MSRSAVVCMTMGTASTMASPVGSMGLNLPTNAALPAVDARRTALAHMTGCRIVAMVEEDLRLSKILKRNSFENAILANAAIGGSTNAVVHPLALAGRMEVELALDDFEIGPEVPLLVNCMPSGRHLMEDFCYAGGIPALPRELSGLLRPAGTVLGNDISDHWADSECFNREVVHEFGGPLKPAAGIGVLRGSLAPNRAIIKPSAADPALLRHEGQACVFEDIEDMTAKIDDPDLPVTAESVLVLKGCGPRGYPGMPEVGNMPLPKRLAQEGVRDMVRASDARMSGTAFGTVVLHVSPESEEGGPLSLVSTGDTVRLDATAGRLDPLVPEGELARIKDDWKPRLPDQGRGYARLCIDHVMQADRGADLDFLVGKDTRAVRRESH